MIQFDVTYRPGSHTAVYLFFTYGWWLMACGAVFGYLAYSMYFGTLHAFTEQFLANRPTWGVDVGMLSLWSACLSAAFFFIAVLRAWVQYRWYSFHVDDHAFHMSRGLIGVQEITIPYRQISNVHIGQPYIWRLFGLAQLDITVSSSRDESLSTKKRRDFLVPCIDKSLARALSQFLVRQATGDVEDEEGGDDEEGEYDDQDDAEDISINEERGRGPARRR